MVSTAVCAMNVNRLVLDLSHHNTVTDFAAIKAAGIVGVIHKATEGQTYVDETFRDRRADAREVGLLWGAYHFLRPGNMQAQAEHFVETANDTSGVLLAADHEDPGVSADDLLEFLSAIEILTGQAAVIYSGHLLKEQIGNGPADDLARHRLWLAQYGSSPSWPAAWSAPWLWQYTDGSNGPQPHTCPGVEGPVDGNSYAGSAAELVAGWAGLATEPEPQPGELVVTIKIDVPAGVVVRVEQTEH